MRGSSLPFQKHAIGSPLLDEKRSRKLDSSTPRLNLQTANSCLRWWTENLGRKACADGRGVQAPALSSLDCDVRVALAHYAPVRGTAAAGRSAGPQTAAPLLIR